MPAVLRPELPVRIGRDLLENWTTSGQDIVYRQIKDFVISRNISLLVEFLQDYENIHTLEKKSAKITAHGGANRAREMNIFSDSLATLTETTTELVLQPRFPR